MHLSLEREFAALHRKESVLVFSSCYIANIYTRFQTSWLSLLLGRLQPRNYMHDTEHSALR
jgi:7-keto-8-aminopelargonate synthetase-like enzyme